MSLYLNEIRDNPEARFAIINLYSWIGFNYTKRVENFENVKISVSILFKNILQLNQPIHSRSGAEFCQKICVQLKDDLIVICSEKGKNLESCEKKYTKTVWRLLMIQNWFKGGTLDLDNPYVKMLKISKTK